MKSGFIIYNDWKDLLDDLSLEDRGRVFTALFDVADGEDPDKIDNPAARMLLKVMTKQMQKDADAYERKCEKNRDNAKQRTQANATERKPSQANATERKRTGGDNDKDNDNDKENDKESLKDKEKTNVNVSKKESEKVGVAAEAATSARKEKFYASLVPFVDKYGKDMIRDFFDYWSEMNRSKTKMRFEQQATWELALRLKTWADREKVPDKGRKPDMSVGVVLHNTDEDYELTKTQLW
jgi:hypothetical protein